MSHPRSNTQVPADDLVRARFRARILDPAFACVGAKSAVQREQYRLEVYVEMGGAASSRRLAGDLSDFVQSQDIGDPGFSTFAAAFGLPQIHDEQMFEALLWKQLQGLHRLDQAPWDPSVSSDPLDDTFAFSYAGRAFFVVGLHPAASRLSRQFAWPTLVFNARFQFEHLRARGQYERMQAVIRARERAIQGNENPMLSDFGTRSEARQYSGRPVEEGWTCPFRAGRDGTD
jgi:FPC/CPF motif-containing protein YcgG